MTSDAARDLGIGRKYTPGLVSISHLRIFPKKYHFDAGIGKFWPDLSDWNNLEVIIKAEGISVMHRRDYPPSSQWRTSIHIAPFRIQHGVGTTPKEAIFALLDPRKDGET